MRLVLCQLYPEHLSIYADRGNVQVIRRRLEWRGLELEERPLRVGEELDPDAADLYLIGGGQDRDQLLVADDLQRHRAAHARGRRRRRCRARRVRRLPAAPATATSARTAARCRASACSTSRRAPATTRLIGDIVCECDLGDGAGTRTMVGFENHAGQTRARRRAASRSRASSAATATTAPRATRARAPGNVARHLRARPAAAEEPWLADWLIERALERRHGSVELEPLDDALELAAAARPSRRR